VLLKSQTEPASVGDPSRSTSEITEIQVFGKFVENGISRAESETYQQTLLGCLVTRNRCSRLPQIQKTLIFKPEERVPSQDRFAKRVWHEP
jgi:hypothetical protein